MRCNCFSMLESGDAEAVVLRNALKAYHEKLTACSHAGGTALLKHLQSS